MSTNHSATGDAPSASRRTSMAHGVRELGQLDIAGGGQVVVQDGHAYVGHMSPPDGTSVIDVRDPRAPRVVATVTPPSPHSHTHKVRVVGNLMITNVERHRRHFYRKGERLTEIEAQLGAELGRTPTDAEVAARAGVAADDIPELRAGLARGYAEGGFRIHDISDPGRPRELTHQMTGGIGVHRFDADERYAYISTEMDGFIGNILVIYDLAHPTQPEEVGRWWMPGQHLAGGEEPHWEGRRHRLHHALREGNRLWAACWYAGAWLLDAGDLSRPRTLGTYQYQPPFPEPTHTFQPLRHRFEGRQVALIADEQHDHVRGQPPAFLWVMDVTDPTAMRALSTFHVSALDSPFAGLGARFGLHQFEEHLGGPLVYAAWFSGGLRIIDLSEPERPREAGSYVPAPIGSEPAPQSNDVAVDDRGLIYLLDRNRGLHILEHQR